MESEFKFENDAIELVVDLRVYSLTAIKKTAYRLADRCTAVLGIPTADQLRVVLKFRPDTKPATATETTRRFFQELLDQDLRERVAAETDAIRTLILAQAFSKTDLINRE